MKALYAGTFDPFTLGHLDIVLRAQKLFGEVKILVANNFEKQPMFDIDQRVEIIQKSLTDNFQFVNIPVVKWQRNIAEYIETYGADVIIRGIRNATDLEYEIMLEQYNRDTSGIEVVYLTPKTENLHTSSSLVRNFIKTQRFTPLQKYVTPSVHEYILDKKKIKEHYR